MDSSNGGRKRLLAWTCDLCGDENTSMNECQTCQHPCHLEPSREPPPPPSGKDEGKLLAPPLPEDPNDFYFDTAPLLWTCESCGEAELEDWVQCRTCQSDRWNLQTFDGKLIL